MVRYNTIKALTTINLVNKKRAIRRKILKLLNDQKEVERLKKSRAIKRKLFALKEFKKAKNIMFFASFDGEVETFEMIRQAMKLGKRILLPKIIKEMKQIVPLRVFDLEKELDIGPYGIKEPKANKSRFANSPIIDLVIVPGLAFDNRGNRLGRGAGYYDRFLGGLPSDIKTVGLAFKFQILKDLPFRKNQDVPVGKVLFA